MLWLAPLLGFVLTLPSILSGYVQDDHVHRQRSLDTSVWDTFRCLVSDAGVAACGERSAVLTWWTPGSARVRFFRPAASLLHAFEFRCFEDAPWVMHVNRALLYASIVFLCVKLMARLSSTPAACGIACLIFAIDDVHAYSTGWISAANTLLACVFGLFALLMHDRWRRDGAKTGLALSLLGFVLALLSSEGGLALMGYLVAYALFLESGGWKKRIVTLVPSALVAGCYLVSYSSLHLGARGSFDYLSPTEDLGQTAVIVLQGVVTGTLSQILSVPMLCMMLQTAGGATIAAVLLAALIMVFWRFIRESKTVAFFGVGMGLSIVPYTIGMMGDRYLFWAGLGAAGLLGELLATHSFNANPQRTIARMLLVTNTGISLVLFVPTLFWLAPIERNIRKLEEIVTSKDTVMLNGSPIADNCAAAIRYAKHGQWPEHFLHLYNGLEPLTLRRTGERTLLATLPKGWFAPSFMSRGTLPKNVRFERGARFELEVMTATIEDVTQDGRPRSVSFAFKKDLADFVWLESTMKGPKSIQVPAVGEEIRAGSSAAPAVVGAQPAPAVPSPSSPPHLSEPPGADPHAGWCGRGPDGLPRAPMPIRATFGPLGRRPRVRPRNMDRS